MNINIYRTCFISYRVSDIIQPLEPQAVGWCILTRIWHLSNGFAVIIKVYAMSVPNPILP